VYPLETPRWLVEYCIKRIGGSRKVQRLRRMYNSGKPVRDIMARFGLKSPDCIYALVEPKRRGRYRGRVRITPEVEERIIELRKAGASIPQIARELGVSVGSVHRVLKRRGLAGSRSGARG